MIKAVFFDLDGVLLDTKDLHRFCLSSAIRTYQYSDLLQHLPNNQMTSNEKLEVLNKHGLPNKLNTSIIQHKHELTLNWIDDHVKYDNDLVVMLQYLKSQQIYVCIVTNTNKEFVQKYMLKAGIFDYVDDVVSNELIERHKPYPDPYEYALKISNVSPSEALVFEDSDEGLLSATQANIRVTHIQNFDNLHQIVLNAINLVNNNRWHSANTIYVPDLNIVIPMAGEGSRFKNAGYTVPKPFIQVHDEFMVEAVLNSLNVIGHVIFLARTDTVDERDVILHRLSNDCDIIDVNYLTQGAACTVLLAKQYIDNDKPLMIVNSDNIVTFDYIKMLSDIKRKTADSVIFVFEGEGTKWSYARLDEKGYVIDTAEKIQISNNATSGVYYFKQGKDFVRCAQKMIDKNIRVNNEFYVAPVYNQMIECDQKVIVCQSTFDSLGTPEDLMAYLNKDKL